MSEYKERIDHLWNELKERRDEIKLKIHLGRADAQDEWERLEEKWREFKTHGKALTHTAGESARDVKSALELLGEELRNGYDRIRKKL